MTRQEIIDIISEQSTEFKAFVEEYSNEYSLNNADNVLSFLGEMLSSVQCNSIPDTFLSRVETMLGQLKIKELSNLQKLWKNKHDFEIYKDAYNNTILGSYFSQKTFGLFKAIGFVNTNVVLIGANGSGKTMFANSIRSELEQTENGIVIPAQKILIFPTYSHIPTYQHAYSVYNNREKETLDDKQTFTASQDNDIPYGLIKTYGSEMKLLLSTLLGDWIARRTQYCSSLKTGEIADPSKFRSRLDEVIEIWNDLIGHRKLFCDDSCNLKIKTDKEEYPAYKMSDGEREIFYVVGRVLLAKASALIIIDEPELHLHKSILNKLWDKLEQCRNDCMFIYLTHDIDFAATRSAKKCWLKSYTSGIREDWDVEPIPEDIIPEALLMKLLGSRKRILFCEGREQSLDYQIFEVLFPNYTIVPVASCKDVINYTRAFNKIETKYAEATGIIDTDFRTTEQLAKLSGENVFSYDVAEIENLFMLEDFIKGFAEYKKETCDVDIIKDRVLKQFEQDIDLQASLYVTQKINTRFNESHLKNGKTKDEVKQFFSDFTSEIDIDKWFNERLGELRAIISNKDYAKAIRFYNNKGLHSIVEKCLGISSYGKKSLDFLKKSEEAQMVLRKSFPAELQAG